MSLIGTFEPFPDLSSEPGLSILFESYWNDVLLHDEEAGAGDFQFSLSLIGTPETNVQTYEVSPDFQFSLSLIGTGGFFACFLLCFSWESWIL
ncbi:hypothetical protein PYCH_06570 [Pyrococcus yayanosii CH1]|uniref:Uncharacterized protein n=1 Tax=Pyrococcus yayanosii (strain CH1 / JCM 16557) TaxID=529709 RepID=F8AIH9_PYRYC|nr:hypothetical protein PYCH_06570 [Pyrococcus yayanosii CH1]